MGAHVFVVDKTTFPVHRDRGFCGVLNPKNMATRMSVVADLKTLRAGDRVFFYKRRIDEPPEERGFYGIYKIATEPFFDPRKVKGVGRYKSLSVAGSTSNRDYSNQPLLPNRVLIELVTYFEHPIPDTIAYVDKADPDQLWTMLFRKIPGAGRARSISHLLPEEETKVIRLLYKINLTPAKPPPSQPYPKSKSRMRPIKVDLSTVNQSGELLYESSLKAWLAENIDKQVPVLRDILGPTEDMEFFSPEVLYGIGGEKIDFLCLHKKNLDDGTMFRYKVSVIECKKGAIDEYSVFQVQRYSRWMAQLVPESDVSIVQPILVGHTAEDRVVDLAQQSKYGRQPIIIEYSVKRSKVQLKRRL